MSCECALEYKNNLESLSRTQDIKGFGECLQCIAVQWGFDQALLLLEFPTPFSRHNCLAVTSEAPLWSGPENHDFISKLRPILQRCSNTAGMIEWHLDCWPGSGPDVRGIEKSTSVQGVAGNFMSNCGVVNSILFIRKAEGVEEIKKEGLYVRMACVLDLVRQAQLKLHLESYNTASLTGRELEVLRWTADGKSVNEISTILQISENTVNYHVKKILAKTGCLNKLQAVALAATYKII